MHMMHGYGFSWTMLIMGMLWIGLIIFGIYLTFSFIRGNNPKPRQQQKPPLQILNKRLANGEIDEAEYERLKTIILEDEKQ